MNWKGGISKKVDYQKGFLQRLRRTVLQVLGDKCKICGFSDYRALQIDHIKGGGSKERKEKGFSSQFHRHVLNNFLNGENKYQLLCANCNWIKRFENKNELGGKPKTIIISN